MQRLLEPFGPSPLRTYLGSAHPKGRAHLFRGVSKTPQINALGGLILHLVLALKGWGGASIGGETIQGGASIWGVTLFQGGGGFY